MSVGPGSALLARLKASYMHGARIMHTSGRYTLVILTAILAVNQLDRNILGILLDDIGQEFALSDTQLGLLSGALFVAVYVLFGFPVAKLASRGNRRNIIAVSSAVWSALTIAMAGAQNFLQLALARLGVGIGEAGAVVPAHSMISDLYPPEKRTSAMATFVVGANIGVLLAFLIGGIAGQFLGWRWALVIAGAPGFVLAFLMWLTVDEPQRAVQASNPQKKSLLIEALKAIWSRQRPVPHHAGRLPSPASSPLVPWRGTRPSSSAFMNSTNCKRAYSWRSPSAFWAGL